MTLFHLTLQLRESELRAGNTVTLANGETSTHGRQCNFIIHSGTQSLTQSWVTVVIGLVYGQSSRLDSCSKKVYPGERHPAVEYCHMHHAVIVEWANIYSFTDSPMNCLT